MIMFEATPFAVSQTKPGFYPVLRYHQYPPEKPTVLEHPANTFLSQKHEPIAEIVPQNGQCLGPVINPPHLNKLAS